MEDKSHTRKSIGNDAGSRVKEKSLLTLERRVTGEIQGSVPFISGMSFPSPSGVCPLLLIGEASVGVVGDLHFGGAEGAGLADESAHGVVAPRGGADGVGHVGAAVAVAWITDIHSMQLRPSSSIIARGPVYRCIDSRQANLHGQNSSASSKGGQLPFANST